MSKYLNKKDRENLNLVIRGETFDCNLVNEIDICFNKEYGRDRKYYLTVNIRDFQPAASGNGRENRGIAFQVYDTAGSLINFLQELSRVRDFDEAKERLNLALSGKEACLSAKSRIIR